MSIRIVVADGHESANDREARHAVEGEVSELLAENPGAQVRGLTVETSGHSRTRVFSVLVELPDRGVSQ